MFTRAIATLFVLSASVAGGQSSEQARWERIEAKLDRIIRRIESIEERISRLEQNVMRPVGLKYFERRGILYDADGREVGMWGVNGQRMIVPNGQQMIVPKR